MRLLDLAFRHCSLAIKFHRPNLPNRPLLHGEQIRQLQFAHAFVVYASSPIEPGSSPEQVVKRISKGKASHRIMLQPNIVVIEGHKWQLKKPDRGMADCLSLGADDVEVSFARSGGSGGQNVNKVNTKVDMRLSLDADWISEDMQDALQRLEKKRINKEGELILTSQRTRSQANNVDDALLKMQDCLDRAAESIIPAKPDPEKAKEMNKRKKVANENRIQAKKMKSDKKKARRSKIDY